MSDNCQDGAWVLLANAGRFKYAKHKSDASRYRWIAIANTAIEYSRQIFPRSRQLSYAEFEDAPYLSHEPHEGRCGVVDCAINEVGVIDVENRRFLWCDTETSAELSCVEPDEHLIETIIEWRLRIDLAPPTRAGKRR
jgi:hypothetical protein